MRFEVEAAADAALYECNCSICRRAGYLHLIVATSHFRLLRGHQSLTSYAFHTRVARHLFCTTCGIKSFYVPRSHPEGYSVNARCLDDFDLEQATILPFDGDRWEEHAEELPPLGAPR